MFLKKRMSNAESNDEWQVFLFCFFSEHENDDNTHLQKLNR